MVVAVRKSSAKLRKMLHYKETLSRRARCLIYAELLKRRQK